MCRIWIVALVWNMTSFQLRAQRLVFSASLGFFAKQDRYFPKKYRDELITICTGIECTPDSR
jgi:hypothetical protein